MKKSTWIALLLPGLLAACALESKRIEVPGAHVVDRPIPVFSADQLLNYFVKARKLDAREFAAERDSARNRFQSDKSDFNRVRYALMLSLAPVAPSTGTNLSVQDDAELIGLMEPLIASTGTGSESADAPIRALAALLHGAASDRRKLREQLRDSQARLALVKKDDMRDAEARALRTRAEELETQLNALKLIERSVNRRAEEIRK